MERRDLAKEKTEVYQEAVTPLYLRNFMQPQSMQAAARVLTDILFLPNNKIFETVDAICPSRGYVVQNTVADKHDLKFDGLREVYKVFPGDTQVRMCLQYAIIMLFHILTSKLLVLGGRTSMMQRIHCVTALLPFLPALSHCFFFIKVAQCPNFGLTRLLVSQVTVFFMVPPERFSTFKKPVLKFNEKGFEDGKPTPAAQAQYTKQANHTVEEEAEYRTSWVKPNKAEREQFHTDKQRAKNMRQVVVAVPISASSDVNTVILPIESFLHTPSSVAASPTMGSLSGSQLGSTPCDQQLVTSDSSNHQHLSSTESSSSRILFPGA